MYGLNPLPRGTLSSALRYYGMLIDINPSILANVGRGVIQRALNPKLF